MTTPEDPRNIRDAAPQPSDIAANRSMHEQRPTVASPQGLAPDADRAHKIEKPKKNIVAIAALLLGILSIILFFTSVIGIIIGIIAVVLGIIGLVNAKKGGSKKKGLAVGGIVTGLIGILLGALLTAGVIAFFQSGTGKCVENAQGDRTKTENCIK